MTRVLVTGGAGFIASHLTDRLLERGDDVLVIDNFATARRDTLPEHEHLRVVEGTIADTELVRRALRRLQARGGRTRRRVVQGSGRLGRGRAHERGRDGERRAGGRANRRRPARLLPDGALLRDPPRGAADHADAPARPVRVELRDLQDGGRVVRTVERVGLGLVPPRERLRPPQPERPAADVLPAAHRREVGVRHGHAPRLRLRRRSRRGCDEGPRRHRIRHLPRLVG